jgi:hypothetical protein
VNLGELLVARGGNDDMLRARKLFFSACGQEEAIGCAALGRFYATGKGMPSDPGMAAQMFERACDLGDPSACYQIGDALTQRSGDAQAKIRALELIVESCIGGHAAACADLDRRPVKAQPSGGGGSAGRVALTAR